MTRAVLIGLIATIGLTVPFLMLGILGAAWLTQNLTQLATTIATAATLDWGRLALEGWSRWPEVLGMIIGQALILAILLLARDRASLQANGEPDKHS
jgi:Ca2+/Na+ antiporter